MNSYEALESSVFSVFNTDEWQSENIKTYPSNFLALDAGNEYVRLTIIPSGSGLNLNSKSGVLIIDIFTPAGNGPRRSSLIADKLDKYLVGKSVEAGNRTTQFGNSSFSPVGNDKDNPSLYRSTYSIPFNHFGV